jgi:hypothetical protein
MDKYQAVTILHILDTMLCLGIIFISFYFEIYILLMLLLFISSAKAERRILGLKENEEENEE